MYLRVLLTFFNFAWISSGKSQIAIALISRELLFSEDIQVKLKHAFDQDGYGFIDTEELLQAATLFEIIKSANSYLHKGLCAAAGRCVLLVGANACLTGGIVHATKDTTVRPGDKVIMIVVWLHQCISHFQIIRSVLCSVLRLKDALL